MEQISKYAEDLRRIYRALQAQQGELDLIILRTPSGHIREELSSANIHILAAMKDISEVC